MPIKAKKSIYNIAPYIAGASQSDNTQPIIKLSSNEGALGPSPMAIKAVNNMTANMHRYPDSGCVDLRYALAESNNINADHIICGAGSDELISLLCQAYIGEGDEMLYSAHGFLMYPISAMAAGGTPVKAPETEDLKTSVDNLLSAVTPATKILFIANPNNPTGTYIKRDEIVHLRKNLRDDILLVLDAAYCEYVDDPDYTSGHDLVEAYDNIVVLRTFSKLYALGGVRLGWAHAPEHVIDILNRVRGPFNVSSVAQIAGLAALQDDEFLQESLALNKEMRDLTIQTLNDLDYTVIPSACNFVLADFGSAENANHILTSWQKRGVLVREMGAYGLPSFLRISVSNRKDMELALGYLKDIHSQNSQ